MNLIGTLSELHMHITKCDMVAVQCDKCRTLCDDMTAIKEGLRGFVIKYRLLNVSLVVLRVVFFPILYPIYAIRGAFRYATYEFSSYRVSNRMFADLSFIWSVGEFRNQVALHCSKKEIYYDETMHRMIRRGVAMRAPIVGVEVEGWLVGENQRMREWFERTEIDNIRNIFLKIVDRYYSILFWQERSFRRSHTVYIFLLNIAYILLILYILISRDFIALWLVFVFILSEPLFMFDYVIGECFHMADYETHDRLMFYRNMINFQIALFTLLLTQVSSSLVGSSSEGLVLYLQKWVDACGSTLFEFFNKWKEQDCWLVRSGGIRNNGLFIISILPPYLSFLFYHSIFKRHLDGIKRVLDFNGEGRLK